MVLEQRALPQSMLALVAAAGAIVFLGGQSVHLRAGFGSYQLLPVGVYAAAVQVMPTSVTVPSTRVSIPAQVDDARLLGFRRKSWPVSSPRDLHQVYGQIFQFGNRNAASHLWSSYVLQNAHLLSDTELEMMLSGFCAISGSPVGPSEYNRYGLRLRKVRDVRKGLWDDEEEIAKSLPAATLHSTDELDEMDLDDDKKQQHSAYKPSTALAVPGNDTQTDAAEARKLASEIAVHERMFGFMHYCCWPCVCDTQDYFWVDSKTVKTRTDIERGLPGTKRWFVVLDSPCHRKEKLHEPFYQPFDGRQTTLARDAAEVRCASDNHLEGATLSDNGYIIYGAFFDARPVTPTEEKALVAQAGDSSQQLQPGRTSYDVSGLKTNKKFQDETEWAGMCQNRAENGYNSGMGEIFRKVAQITTVAETEAMRLQSRALNVAVSRRRRALTEDTPAEPQVEAVAASDSSEHNNESDSDAESEACAPAVDASGSCKKANAEDSSVTPAPPM